MLLAASFRKRFLLSELIPDYYICDVWSSLELLNMVAKWSIRLMSLPLIMGETATVAY